MNLNYKNFGISGYNIKDVDGTYLGDDFSIGFSLFSITQHTRRVGNKIIITTDYNLGVGLDIEQLWVLT